MADVITRRDDLRKTVIDGPEKHRTLLFLCMEKVVTGELSVAQANAVAGLSAEVHKSLAQQFENQIYVYENMGMTLETNEIVVIEGPAKDA